MSIKKAVRMLVDHIERPEGMELQYVEHLDIDRLQFTATLRLYGIDYVNFTFDDDKFLDDIVIAANNSQRAALKKAVEIAFEFDPKIVLDFVGARIEPQNRETD